MDDWIAVPLRGRRAAGADLDGPRATCRVLFPRAGLVVTVLLRAGARVDAIKGQKSADEILCEHIGMSKTSTYYYPVPVVNDVNFREIHVMVEGVRDAGSWRGFINTRCFRPLVRLRCLANRGHATTEDPTLSSLFRLPPRPFRVVLTFCFA